MREIKFKVMDKNNKWWFYTLEDIEECDKELGSVFNTHKYFNKNVPKVIKHM